ncbi:MAG: LON peptidase substrate-binding domain-containing protein [Armatimonadetes bacterium]|nr:LON peptidase substrate-binding domain-containing protein [Armatimonadota bacterium]
MAHLEEMPLFPLHSVLFPYATLQLHVFEARYREMVQHCVDFELPFGVVLIRSGQEVGETAEPYMVGTAVRIARVHELDGDRLEVHVEGERRFRIRRLDESKPYLVGYVEPLVEEAIEQVERTDALLLRARESFQELIKVAIGRPDFSIEIRASDDPSILSFIISGFLPIENLEKQKLLEITDPTQRLAELIPIMERFISDATHPHHTRLSSESFQEWIQDN